MDVDPEIEGVYSGKSDPPSDSKSPAKPGCQAVGAETTTAKSPAVKKRCTMKFGSSDESKYSSRESSHSRSHLYDASAKHEDVLHRDDADEPSRIHLSRRYFSDCGNRSAVIYVRTVQEEQDRSVL